MDLSTILSGPIGAIFGAAGAIGGKIVDYKMAQLNNAHQLAMRDKDMAQAEMEARTKFEVTKLEGETALAVKELDAFGSSFANDRATYGDHILGHIVDLVRGLIRPVITTSGMALVSYVTWIAIQSGPVLTETNRMDIINTSLFLSGTAITWWFGTRITKR